MCVLVCWIWSHHGKPWGEEWAPNHNLWQWVRPLCKTPDFSQSILKKLNWEREWRNGEGVILSGNSIECYGLESCSGTFYHMKKLSWEGKCRKGGVLLSGNSIKCYGLESLPGTFISCEWLCVMLRTDPVCLFCVVDCSSNSDSGPNSPPAGLHASMVNGSMASKEVSLFP